MFLKNEKKWICHTGLYRTMKNDYSLFYKERQNENTIMSLFAFFPALYRPVWRIHFYFNS